MNVFEPVSADVDLPKLEEAVLAFWDKNKVFETSIDRRKDGPSYSFYDGPPFATGLPHYGHLLAGTLKDVVPRYYTMKGFRVDRRFGWDCHGLPVEYEINKKLNLKTNKDIEALGIARYNSECRSIVQRYSNEWKTTVRRMGRWVDMENAYFTMDADFMSSVWWVFKNIYDKNLIYKGYKVVPYSTGLSTALSNFEANQNYKDVQDPAITVQLTIVSTQSHLVPIGSKLLIWTTTPWTLPSNMAVAVNQDADYALVKYSDTEQPVIVAEALVEKTFLKTNLTPEIISTFKGTELLGTRYAPLFPYYEDLQSKGAFQVIHSDHVTLDAGVGLVHMAPAFGEDDYFACQKNGIPLVNPVDNDGVFLPIISDFAGRAVKEADNDIIKFLKDKKSLFKRETLLHSYPFCWRTDTPLIYRAVSSWFLNVEKIKDAIIIQNQTTHWVPGHLKDGRFGKWLENARDWAISRNRFWGTPLPIWENPEGERICVGSRQELETLTGKKIPDLHMEFLADVTIPSPTGKTPLRRTSEVLDCWFESGSMPFAQWGYPQKNVELFEKNFPADFIAEGLDQTRGWFYTLMVIGTAVNDQAPFRNVVVNGLILAEDGKKMSKSLKNYPDPMDLLSRQGADALRLYLLDSPVVKAQEIRFSEKGVSDIVRKILLRWWNSYSFFVNYAAVDRFVPAAKREKTQVSTNILDQWILSRLHSVIRATELEMADYRLDAVIPHLLQFIEDLTNTYIRFNRAVFWESGMSDQKRMAYETLYETLVTFSKVMAPFAPFLSETIFQNLRRSDEGAPISVHFCDFPVYDPKLIQPAREDAVEKMSLLATLSRNFREKIGVKNKVPLRSAKIIHRDPAVLKELKVLEPFLAEEINVRSFEYTTDEESFVTIQAKANFPVLGKRVGPKMKSVAALIQGLSAEQLRALELGKRLTLDGESISLADLEIRRLPKDLKTDVQIHPEIALWIDPTVNEDQRIEGMSREVNRKIQQLRKNAKFNLSDRIQISCFCSDEVRKGIEAHLEKLCEDLLATKFIFVSSSDECVGYIETVELETEPPESLTIGIQKN